VHGSENNCRALPALALGRTSAPIGSHPDAQSTTKRRKLLCWFSLITLCLLTPACVADVTDLHTQKELSEVAGVFTASRFLVYKRSDGRYLYFKEQGKFGSLGPSREFKISIKVFAPHAPEPESVLTYDQNRVYFACEEKTERMSLRRTLTKSTPARRSSIYVLSRLLRVS